MTSRVTYTPYILQDPPFHHRRTEFRRVSEYGGRIGYWQHRNANTRQEWKFGLPKGVARADLVSLGDAVKQRG